MKRLSFFIICYLFFLNVPSLLAQEKKPIIIEHSDFADLNQTEIPDAYVLDGNVRAIHDGIVLTCNKAYYFKNQNYIRAFGNVQMVQGDTLFMNSKYAEYSGDTKQAVGSGSVVMRDPQMTLTTDTIHFDRNIQEAYYNSFGTIRDKENVLTSKSGRYYINQKKFQFLTAVTVTNPTNVIKTNHLDYFTNSGHAYLFGPSTITSKENYIYTEKGFYDTKKNFAHFVKKSFIKYNNRLIEGDSLYYDKNREFASATNNVKITDSINKGIVKGHYAEVFRNQDSLYITKRAVAINLMEKDSVYIHAKVLMVTGKPENRIIRGFDNARFYKIDMSGKCDSIHSNQVNGLTQMIGRPIIWNGESQMTGDIMHLIADKKTEKLDSLKVLNNAFIVQKDTIGTGYNQIKGQNLYGKFKDNKLHEADIIKNTEVIYYTYTDNQELYGIEKNVSSKINIILEDNQISTITFYKKVDGDIYPEKDLPENARKLRGFIWRGDERIKSKDDLFSPEENAMHEAIVKQSKINADAISVPMEIRPETLNYDRDKNKPAEKAKNKDKTKTKKAK